MTKYFDFLKIFLLFCFISGLDCSEFPSDIVTINAQDYLPLNGNQSPRFKREMSLQKIKTYEDCGKIRAKAPMNKELQFFLMDIVEGRVLERKTAYGGEFPWIAALVMNKNGQMFYCGGSLIDHWHVLTSASCVARMSPEDLGHLDVLLGSQNIYAKYEPNRVEAKISQIAYHKGFDSLNMENNIAIIKLRKPVRYSEYILPICLSNGSNIYDNSHALATVSGWGQLLHDPLKQLHKLDVRIWDSQRCIQRYNQGKSEFFPEIRDDSLCAGSPVPSSKNLCQGNNGSPLALKRQRRYELIGLTSWGVGADLFPCVFTRVDKYLNWIQRTIDTFKKV